MPLMRARKAVRPAVKYASIHLAINILQATGQRQCEAWGMSHLLMHVSQAIILICTSIEEGNTLQVLLNSRPLLPVRSE